MCETVVAASGHEICADSSKKCAPDHHDDNVEEDKVKMTVGGKCEAGMTPSPDKGHTARRIRLRILTDCLPLNSAFKVALR